MTITLFTEFYINPSQSTDYHFTPVSKITTDILDNYFYDTDNYRRNIFGINVSPVQRIQSFMMSLKN